MTNGKKGGLGAAVVCLVVGVVLVFVGISDRKFAANCQTTQGQITEVVKKVTTERDRNSKSYRTRKRTSYDITFAYNVDGKEYSDHQNMSSSREVGPATVYYLPSDPSDGKLSKPSAWVDFLGAAVFLIAGIAVGFKSLTMGGATG